MPGKAPVALVGGVGHVHGFGHGAAGRLEAALGAALFGQLVEALLGLDDLFLGFAATSTLRGLGGDLAARAR